MQFRKQSKPPYLNKADQFRMLRMVGLLALVLICMKLAADPEMWSWMFPESASRSEEKKPTSQDVDYGDVKFDDDSPLAPDAFRSRRDDSPPEQTRHQPAIAEASPARLRKEGHSPPDGNAAETTAKVGDYEIRIDPKILEPVADDWLEIRRREAGAFYSVLAKAREIPLKILEEAGDESVDYSVLMTDSKQYRGLPLTIQGIIRRIDQVEVSSAEVRKNYGINGYYVVWMFTESSGNSPYRLISATLPADMPRGENLEVPARFTGYFFKRQGYRSQGGLHKAPVLIGKHIRWNRPQSAAATIPQDAGLAPYAIGLAVMIAIGLGLMIWRFNVSDKKFGHKHVDHFTSATPTAIQELQNLETTDPSELFRQMEEDAIAAELETEES